MTRPSKDPRNRPGPLLGSFVRNPYGAPGNVAHLSFDEK
jgi:hypothetical protein